PRPATQIRSSSPRSQRVSGAATWITSVWVRFCSPLPSHLAGNRDCILTHDLASAPFNQSRVSPIVGSSLDCTTQGRRSEKGRFATIGESQLWRDKPSWAKVADGWKPHRTFAPDFCARLSDWSANAG